MKRSEAFAILLRAIGVWEIILGIESLPTYVGWLLSPEPSVYSSLVSTSRSLWLVYQSVFGLRIAIGLLLLFGAPWFASKVYRDSDPAV